MNWDYLIHSKEEELVLVIITYLRQQLAALYQIVIKKRSLELDVFSVRDFFLSVGDNCGFTNLIIR